MGNPISVRALLLSLGAIAILGLTFLVGFVAGGLYTVTEEDEWDYYCVVTEESDQVRSVMPGTIVEAGAGCEDGEVDLCGSMYEGHFVSKECPPD